MGPLGVGSHRVDHGDGDSGELAREARLLVHVEAHHVHVAAEVLAQRRAHAPSLPAAGGRACALSAAAKSARRRLQPAACRLQRWWFPRARARASRRSARWWWRARKGRALHLADSLPLVRHLPALARVVRVREDQRGVLCPDVRLRVHVRQRLGVGWDTRLLRVLARLPLGPLLRVRQRLVRLPARGTVSRAPEAHTSARGSGEGSQRAARILRRARKPGASADARRGGQQARGRGGAGRAWLMRVKRSASSCDCPGFLSGCSCSESSRYTRFTSASDAEDGSPSTLNGSSWTCSRPKRTPSEMTWPGEARRDPEAEGAAGAGQAGR